MCDADGEERARGIFEQITGRPWERANRDERRLARWAADSDRRAEAAEAEVRAVAEAVQCFR